MTTPSDEREYRTGINRGPRDTWNYNQGFNDGQISSVYHELRIAIDSSEDDSWLITYCPCGWMKAHYTDDQRKKLADVSVIYWAHIT